MSQFRNWMWYPQVLRRSVLRVRVPATRRLPVVSGRRAAHGDGQRRARILPGPPQPGYGAGGLRIPARVGTRARCVHDVDDHAAAMGCGITNGSSAPRDRFRCRRTRAGRALAREPNAPDWDRWVSKNYLVRAGGRCRQSRAGRGRRTCTSRATSSSTSFPMARPESNCQAHLANFFAAVRGAGTVAVSGRCGISQPGGGLQGDGGDPGRRDACRLPPSDFTI